ncbi:peptidyl-prolyl cis-trans isomerase [Cellulophaga sp. HaHaR_3_176]|uniref:peptidylprolyl isomerase n=1 Tax=Cellulophaga sp. HaHaR_3_176 TaxID=1942464 RepID=UPI001C1F7AF0|nr:peptidylprolyl isomerase [Cellulophaga sp. HaHaR_3_176]QWX84478.1 peptidyl-prolyl cis-trans isomerase [Cellulophaga sp. HaHaR_3_176]
MQSSKCIISKIFGVVTLLIFFSSLFSCDSFFKKEEDKAPLARVGESYLYKEDIQDLLKNNVSKEDSAAFVTNYINNWATKQLLLSKSKINLPQEQLSEFNQLIENYKTDLYTRAYKEALVSQSQDTIISDAELASFYEREKQNFRLKEKIVRLRFIELPKQFLNKDNVQKSLDRFNTKDERFLDSIGIQFKKLNFNDSLWVKASRIVNEIPPLTFENEDRYLKKSQFFELQDSLGVYLAKVTDVLGVNETSPLSFVKPTIKQVLLNRRRLEHIRKLETEIIDDAIKDKEFEVYE